MERLTEAGQDFESQFCRECGCTLYGEPSGCNHPNGSCPSYCYFTSVAERLVAYEDAGLTPEEVTDLNRNHAKPKNNADCIRAMSDEELAKFIPNWSYTDACKCSEHYVDCNNECEKCFTEWLCQPADVNPILTMPAKILDGWREKDGSGR